MLQRFFFIVIVFSMFCSGCTSTDKKWNGSNSDEIYSHAANQTVNYSVNWVDEATRGVLDKMDIMIIGDDSSPSGKYIKAATIDLDILIEFSSLTPNSTEMKINIHYPDGQKNKTTANEIFYQTRQFLLSNMPSEKTAPEEPIEPTIESSNTPGPYQPSNLEFPDFQ
jgi:hypothetical protein